jgi:small subunit ribosomal protein S1
MLIGLPEMTQEMENLVTPETPATGEVAALDTATQQTAPQTASVVDPLEPFRAKMRAKEHVQARVVRWQRNGLDVMLEGETPAFMPNDNIDRDPNRNVANYFGKTVPVVITNVRDGKITVSHKAVIEEEIRNAGKERIKELNVGDVLEVKVKTFSKDNVNVDLGPGIDAVIRLKDLSWQHVEHPYEILKRGENVTAKIIGLDRGRRHVQLGIRQLTPDPDLAKYSEYQPEQTVTATVKTLGTHGAEIDLPNGLIAFLPMSEIAWERIGQVSDVLSVGDSVEVKILSVDASDKRITASRKQLIENPMRLIESTFKPGSDHDATIKEVTRGGLVVEMEHNMEGFVPRRELSHDRIERLEDVFKAGKPLEGLRVIEFDRKGQRNGMPRITLSLVAAEREAQRTTLRNYRAKPNASSYSLSDSLAELKAKLEAQGN